MIDAAMEDVSKFKAEFPYNDLPLLPPTGDIETRSLLKACINARTALAELKQATALLPNPAVLINTIPILEAQASSEIEDIVTTTDDLFRYAEDQHKAQKPATKEALRYRSALYEGFQSLQQRPLCTDTAVVVCSRIKAVQMQIRRVPGTALANDQTQQIIYTPPVGETLLRDKLANWERFIHEHADIDPLIRMAVAHYQFEAIHPFTDGNGRTGRVLNLLMLIEQGLLDLPVLYLSRYIIRHRSDYYRLLLDVTRHGHWAEWIQYMLSAVAETAAWTTAKIQAIRGLEAQARDYIRSHAPKAYSRELLEVIFNQPYCRIQNVVDVVSVTRQTGARHLKELVEIGVLQEQRMGKEKLFLHPTFLHLLSSDDNRLPAYRRPVRNVESST
ncbi:Fic family protein [Xanthomonas hyacinthi]|uniref:Protein adenylyltransferase n=1 Tax=Xanthomonas hyacinthi TaxID=56455 RepID=A0A2S7EYI7_9XANT|nr:Fic family protein [Xanthomonas hyacinthi]KLD76823.1 addiction module protein [Xanthomonas hyacinthi DSM 19077]PPU98224.1 Fic family protein [Xanthomonas hyacinthi]QGY76723.1 Fic family protein [Xanthomonas hyacinthi]